MKHEIVFAFALWVMISLGISFFRLLPSGHIEDGKYVRDGADCELRYVDYILPLSRIHCPVNP